MEQIREQDPRVVSINTHEYRRTMAPLRLVEAYWHALCPINGIPSRSDVNPKTIENALEYAFIAERTTARFAKLRVAGMHLNDLMGMSVAGMPLSSLIAIEDREKLADVLQQIFAEPAIVKMSVEAPAGYGQNALKGELILLPLKSDMGDVARILGCLVTVGSLGRSPRRLRITKAQVMPVNTGQETVEKRPDDVAPRALKRDDQTPAAKPKLDRNEGQRPLVLVVDNG